MDIEKTIDRIVESGISKIYPGATVLVAKPGQIVYQKAYGTLDGVKPTNLETIYDLASLTKVVATTTAVMKLFVEGYLHLNDTVGRFLSVEGPKRDITIQQLLSHTSGMPPYSDLWKCFKGKALLEELIKIQPVEQPGKRIIYSCLNFITLMAIVEKITSQSFDQFVYSIFEPLGMKSTRFSPGFGENIAPTSEREGKRLVGLPDDELAYYLGGVSGNAGLFSNVVDLYKFMSSLLEGQIVPKNVVKLFTQKIVQAENGKRHLGWMCPESGGSCGDLLTEKGFGHSGFTGTTIWCREDGLFVIFLTNKGFIKRHEEEIMRIRILLHNVVFGGIECSGSIF
ncbi:serine hydrolase domain-containing protein [Pseudothermotoga thermarum]|uniref:Beta-lactamase n=1 Tax=Pseudothermotoga thermarum DSM 5069 TaxID=688269 RepID=F7YU39_9THEM|nr:serine hydrolase domain-containing protein [Pseudothermotoga thermarum]AEH50135.1 beta-lactamase [Pseudothermotoga thermarum DSM 5069]